MALEVRSLRPGSVRRQQRRDMKRSRAAEKTLRNLTGHREERDLNESLTEHPMQLENEIAIVTGAAQGIGREISLSLAREGALVVIADITQQGLMQTAEMISKNYGSKPKIIPTDITQEDQVANLIQHTLAIDNRIDILVNNAGVSGPIKNIEDISFEEWEATMAVNLCGMFLCCKHVVPVMKKQKKGNIINLSSMTGKRPMVQRTPYATTKMGVIGLTRTLAQEVGKWKIRVNALCPGAVESPRLTKVLEAIRQQSGKSWDQVVGEMTEESALKCLVDPKYVCAMVVFLCSPNGAMITGEDINISAGLVMY